MQRQITENDLAALRKWNWGPFFFGPIWALVNKLDVWAILYFIPPVTILYWLYLPIRGNEIAFQKSQLSIADFVKLQENWSKIAIRGFVWGMVISILFLIIGLIAQQFIGY